MHENETATCLFVVIDKYIQYAHEKCVALIVVINDHVASSPLHPPIVIAHSLYITSQPFYVVYLQKKEGKQENNSKEYHSYV